MRDPLSIEAFADWCEKRVADLEYEADNIRHCAFAQYLRHVGFADPQVGNSTYADGFYGDHTLHPDINAAVLKTPHTFGALTARLRARPSLTAMKE